MNHNRGINRIAIIVAAIVIVGLLIIAAFQDGGLEQTFWALVPPVVAIGLALITKEVYSSLFIGVLLGAIMASGFSFTGTIDNIVNNGITPAVADNAGIFAFLVLLGVIVSIVNKAGGSKAFGAWAAGHIKSRGGAALATFVLGVLIFIDDYFNCLTVGSVMRPLTDEKQISRVKLAYLIDATAAPVCMIAPVSSWAAAVSGCVDSDTFSGFELFVRAIPFNFYSILTLTFIIMISIMGFDYGQMAIFEMRALNGDLVGSDKEIDKNEDEGNPEGASVWDLIFPIILLIITSVIAMLYVGGYFGVDAWGGTDCAGSIIDSFGNTDAFIALPWAAILSLVVIIAYMLIRKRVSFLDAMNCIPDGFKAMVAPMLILTLATSLKNMTGLLGAADYVKVLMESAADGLFNFLPAIIFVVACCLAFATGTSWGTFGILIPIVTNMFTSDDPLLFIGISACLAGAVCGDHCSPISDTTIMASAGAQCNHVDHVATQLPYAFTVAALSFVAFLFSGFIQNIWICLPLAIVIEFITLVIIKKKAVVKTM